MCVPRTCVCVCVCVCVLCVSLLKVGYCGVPVQAELDQGPSMSALRRFNENLRKVPADRWGAWSHKYVFLLTLRLEEHCWSAEVFAW